MRAILPRLSNFAEIESSGSRPMTLPKRRRLSVSHVERITIVISRNTLVPPHAPDCKKS